MRSGKLSTVRKTIGIAILLVVALAALIVAGVKQAGDSTATKTDRVAALSRAQVAKPVAGVPAPLAALRSRVNERVAGGPKALEAQLRALRGHPVVVNLWASWCGPCEYELPFLQRQALERARSVAFLGVNVDDGGSAAAEMARRNPMPYPSFEDPDSTIAEGYRARPAGHGLLRRERQAPARPPGRLRVRAAAVRRDRPLRAGALTRGGPHERASRVIMRAPCRRSASTR